MIIKSYLSLSHDHLVRLFKYTGMAFTALRGMAAMGGAQVTMRRVVQRHLHLHEAYSIDLLKKFGVTTPRCGLAHTAQEASAIANSLGDLLPPGVITHVSISIGGDHFAVKAQVLAGGRGKGHFENGFKGGVHVVK